MKTDFEGIAHFPNDEVSFAEDTTLLAVWLKKIKVTYAENLTTGATANNLTVTDLPAEFLEHHPGADFTVAAELPKMGDIPFLGWAKTADAKEPLFYPGSIIAGLDKDLELFAIWPLVFISPSHQTGNQYKNTKGTLWPHQTAPNNTEKYWMWRIKDDVETALENYGLRTASSTESGGSNAANVLNRSNNEKSTVHIALHSNAANGNSRGVLGVPKVVETNGSVEHETESAALANAVVSAVATRFGMTNRGIVYGTRGNLKTGYEYVLFECRPNSRADSIKAASFYIEYAFHDNKEDAMWLMGHEEISAADDELEAAKKELEAAKKIKPANPTLITEKEAVVTEKQQAVETCKANLTAAEDARHQEIGEATADGIVEYLETLNPEDTFTDEHIVTSADTVAKLATARKTTKDKIVARNLLKNENDIKVGQKLMLPPA
jgi:LysM repeat protein